MSEPVNRTVLFDPGEMSADLVRKADLVYLDDMVITHEHFDHFNLPLIQELVAKFPDVQILASKPVVDKLAEVGIPALLEATTGMEIFDAPHESLEPLSMAPPAIGVHYLNTLTHPGDSHHFAESKAVLAVPMTGPWGTSMRAAQLIADLKPQYVIPIHDWMWRDEWRLMMYKTFDAYCQKLGVTFISPIAGEPFVLDVPHTAKPIKDAGSGGANA
jgi:L-ascorbate metabolism protein UlaG (beta-lactamase superfamily)